MTMEAQEPQSQPPTSEQLGFEIINPPLPVLALTEVGEHVRGYILGRQFDPDEVPFYVMQLTEACAALMASGPVEMKVGQQIAIYETKSIKGCAKLMPNIQTVPTGERRAAWAYEVIFEAVRYGKTGWHYLAAARRVMATGAQQPIGAPAPFSLPELSPSELPKPKRSA